MSDFTKYASVLLDVAIDKTLDYGIPPELEASAVRGMRVEVPIRGRLVQGYIFELKNTPEIAKVHSIKRLISDSALIDDQIFELGLWMARYYCTPIRQVFKAILPASVRKEGGHKEQLFVMRAKTREEIQLLCQEMREKNPAQVAVLEQMLLAQKGILLTELLEKTGGTRSPVDTLAKKGILKVDIVRVDRSPLINEDYFQTKAKILNENQAEALSKIETSLSSGTFTTHLLHGITGSGKTEVYLQAIDHALKMGKRVIMLVPEIALTPQTIERFRSRFEGEIAILHHRLSQGERYDEWHRIRRGEANIVIGARSAIFSPVPNLGLIIVDEEHEQSYKHSEEQPCYQARDIAVKRGSLANATVILGSATPSLESSYNARTGKYILSVLKSRADSASQPKITIVDMKREFEIAGGYTNFSEALLDAIKKRRDRGEQTILFLNRRGYHTTLFCKGCREAVTCKHCDTTLTFHFSEQQLSCHLCGYTIAPPPRQCPKCNSHDTMKYRGVGTEQIERSLHAILKDIRTTRMDADTTKHKGAHQKLLREFGTGKADVLIGTQMIAKGLHFPEVTLVGVLNADSSLNIPDFRSSETAFQLLTQVAGRSGRGVTAGEVIIQTCMPENEIIAMAAKEDYYAFYENEIATRELFKYPPFTRLVKVSFSGVNEKNVKEYGEKFRRDLIKRLPEQYEIHPLNPAGHAKVKDNYRYQFLVRGQSTLPMSQALSATKQHLGFNKEIRTHIDVDPSSTFF